ncbi:unnamed protein product [Withania somnifera]
MSERRFRFGYVLASKKVTSFIQDSLIKHAQQNGIDLIPIDLNKPLLLQGPFDCIFHKLYDAEWRKQLEEFTLHNPSTVIVDPIDAIEKLHSRISMLHVVNQLKIKGQNKTIGIPIQIFFQENSEPPLDAITRKGLHFPVIAKPLIANGTADSHQMSMVLKPEGLEGLKAPLVLQEFVNHGGGGVIFKVYVAGKHVKCVKRRSLPDISEEKLGTLENSVCFSQISNLTAQDQNDHSFDELIEKAVMPPSSFVTDVANQLRDALKLHLFNFDMIRDNKVGNRYLIIDINYFPGYAKMPNYETMMTAFFLDIVREGQNNESRLASDDHRTV